jgi:hypothetical protein
MVNWPAHVVRGALIAITIGLLTVLTSRMYTNEHGKADIFHPWYAQHTSTLRIVYTLATIETVILTITGRSFTQTNYTPIPQVLALSVLAIALGAVANSTHDWDTDNVHHAGILMLTVGLSCVQIFGALVWSWTLHGIDLLSQLQLKPIVARTVAVTINATLHLFVLASANYKQKSAVVATGICTLVISAMITWGISTGRIAMAATLNLILACAYTTKTIIIAMATVRLILIILTFGVIRYKGRMQMAAVLPAVGQAGSEAASGGLETSALLNPTTTPVKDPRDAKPGTESKDEKRRGRGWLKL